MILLQLAACMSLDAFFFDPTKVEEYAIDFDTIPEELVEEVTFPSGDGTELHGIWVRQPIDASPLVYFHGNSSDIGAYWDRMEYHWLTGRYDIFIFDYRCYGRSEGECTYDGVVETDGLAAAEYVSETTGFPPEEIPWIGHSLGASVAVHTSDEIAAQSIVIENMFASADAIGDDGTGLDLPSGWFFEEPFDNVEAISKITAPIFIIHGLADDYILPEYADDLYEAAPDPKEIWQPEGVGHSDMYELIPEEYRSRVEEFQSRWR